MEKYTDEMTANFKDVVADTEALLKATANQSNEKIAEIRAKAVESLKLAKVRMTEAQDAMLVRTKAAAKATDVYVHENPWQSIGVAAGIGVAIGLLIGRR